MKHRPLRVALVAVASTALATGLLASVGPSASAAGRTLVNDCGDLLKKPADISFACADDSAMLTEMKWKRWSNGQAKGSGYYEMNDCEPTCVDGTVREYPVNVVLKKAKNQAGKRVFTTAVLTFKKARPAGKKKAYLKIPTYTLPLPQTNATATPTPAATAGADTNPTPSASASATPTATASQSATATATATATPTATATATAQAIAPPTLTLESIRKVGTGRLIVTVHARSKARGGENGIRKVTVYRPNEYNAELDYKANFIGRDTAARDEWSATLVCDTGMAKMKDTLRIVAEATDGQKTELRTAQTVNGC